MSTSELKCDNCGCGGARVRLHTQTLGRGAGLLIVENVPVVLCPHCGESYMTLETVLKLEKIQKTGKRKAARREFNVVEFA